MKITDIRLTGLAGATPEGGWADELKPEDDLHTLVEIDTDEGLVGVGSAMTSKALVAAAVKLLWPLLHGERRRTGASPRSCDRRRSGRAAAARSSTPSAALTSPCGT